MLLRSVVELPPVELAVVEHPLVGDAHGLVVIQVVVVLVGSEQPSSALHSSTFGAVVDLALGEDVDADAALEHSSLGVGVWHVVALAVHEPVPVVVPVRPVQLALLEGVVAARDFAGPVV